MDADAARDRLRAWWSASVGSGPRSLTRFDGVVAGYAEGHRRYHDVAHLVAVLDAIEDLAETEHVGDRAAVMAAGFYHDVIYQPLADDNEELSAQRAETELAELGWTAERARSVADLVRATITHDPGTPSSDTAVLLDADLSVLGGDGRAYDRYLRAVRTEYAEAGVDDATWAAGRADVLRRLLGRERLFATETGRDRWETAARRNLGAELETLRRGYSKSADTASGPRGVGSNAGGSPCLK